MTQGLVVETSESSSSRPRLEPSASNVIAQVLSSDVEKPVDQKKRVATLPYKWDSLIDAPCLCVSAAYNDDLPAWPVESGGTAATHRRVRTSTDDLDGMPLEHAFTSTSEPSLDLDNPPSPPPAPSSISMSRTRSTIGVHTFVNPHKDISIETIGNHILSLASRDGATPRTNNNSTTPVGVTTSKPLPTGVVAAATAAVKDKHNHASLLSPTTIALITKESGDQSDMAYYTEASSSIVEIPLNRIESQKELANGGAFGPVGAAAGRNNNNNNNNTTTDQQQQLAGGPELMLAANRSRSVPIIPVSRHNPRASPVSESLVFDDLFAGIQDETDQEVAQYSEEKEPRKPKEPPAPTAAASSSGSSSKKSAAEMKRTQSITKSVATKHSKSTSATKHSSKNSSSKQVKSSSGRRATGSSPSSKKSFGKQLKVPSENHHHRHHHDHQYHHHSNKKKYSPRSSKRLEHHNNDDDQTDIDLDDPKGAMKALRELKNNSPLLLSKMSQLQSVLRTLKREKMGKLSRNQHYSVRQQIAENPEIKNDAQALYTMLEEILHSDHEDSEDSDDLISSDSDGSSFASYDNSVYTTGFIDQLRSTNFLAPVQKVIKTVYKSAFRTSGKKYRTGVVRASSSVSYSDQEDTENHTRGGAGGGKMTKRSRKKNKSHQRSKSAFNGNFFDYIAQELSAAISSRSASWSSDEDTYDDKINKTISFRSRQSSGETGRSRRSRHSRPPSKRRRSRAASRGSSRRHGSSARGRSPRGRR